MPHYHIHGADRESGTSRSFMVEGGSESDALILANARGVAVNTIRVVPPPAAPSPSHVAVPVSPPPPAGPRPMTMDDFEELDKRRAKRGAATWENVSGACALIALLIPFVAIIGVAAGLVAAFSGRFITGMIAVLLNIVFALVGVFVGLAFLAALFATAAGAGAAP